MKTTHFWLPLVAILSIATLFPHTTSTLLLAQPAEDTAIIGGCLYAGANEGYGPVYHDGLPDHDSLTPAINDAAVMVQNQHHGGAFITYADVINNCWTAEVPAPGDYVVMFSAPGYDTTSREFTVDIGDYLTKDAYLPPLPLPTANLLAYAFYDNLVNGEDDMPDDPPLNGVIFRAWDEDGNLLATGVSGTQPLITFPDGTRLQQTAGYYYFTGLPPGEIYITSDPSTVYHYDVNGDLDQLPILNPATGQPLDFDANTEFYLMSSEEGGRAFEAVLYPGDPGIEDGAYLVWHGFVEKLGMIDETNVAERFPPGTTLADAGIIGGWLTDADMAYDPVEPADALVPPLHPGVTANEIVPDGFVVLFTDDEAVPTHPVATAESDPLTGAFVFPKVPPGRYKAFLSDVPIDYVYVSQQVSVRPKEAVIMEEFLTLLPRFYARAQGYVKDASTGLPIAGATVNIRFKDGSIQYTQTTDDLGWYNFDDLPEIEVLGYVDVEPPPGYRGAIVTDTFYPNAFRPDPTCDPAVSGCVELGDPYFVSHNAMNRYIQWYTANYRADLFLEPLPENGGDVAGFVFYDHLEVGTWVGDGIFDPFEERTMPGVVVELWNAEETTLIASTTSGKFDKTSVLAQGWHEPYTWPIDEWGGVFVGPMPGYFEFRDLDPGDYIVKVIPPDGFAPSPAGSDVVAVTIRNSERDEVDFGINTTPPGSPIGVPLAGEIEGGVFDDLNIDHRGGELSPAPDDVQSLLFAEKAGIDKAPVGVYDHLGYFMGAGYMGNPLCYAGAPDVPGQPGVSQCPPDEDPLQKPELERRFAPGTHIYLGNDPSLAGYCANYLPLALPYEFGQGKYKFEADWSLVPVAAMPGNIAGRLCNIDPWFSPDEPIIGEFVGVPGVPALAELHTVLSRFKFPLYPDMGELLLEFLSVRIDATAIGGSYVISGANFGDEQGYSTVSLGGRELNVISWSDSEIRVEGITDPVGELVVVTTVEGSSNAIPLTGLTTSESWTTYMAERSVFVDGSNAGLEDGSSQHPWNSITEALAHLPIATPRYVFVAPGTYNERIQIAESDIELIGAGPKETIINGLSEATVASQGFSNGGGPVIYIGAGGEYGSVQNVMISGFTITGGTVNEDGIGGGIFGDYGNSDLDINNNIIVSNGGLYGGGIWLHRSNHDVKIWSNTIAENGNYGGYGGGISINSEPDYHVTEHREFGVNLDDPAFPVPCNSCHEEQFIGDRANLNDPTSPMPCPNCEGLEHIIDDHFPWPPPGLYLIYNNHILHNYSPDYGGGISMYEVKDQLMIYGNVIEENKSEDHGGGAFFEDTGPISIYSNKFLRNLTYDDGGAISFEDVGNNASLVRIYNNLIAENIADDHGENHARGGGLAFDDTFNVRVFNNTIVGNIVAGSNTAAGGGIDAERNGHEYNGTDGEYVAPGFSDPRIYNNIIWGNWRLHYDQPTGVPEEEDLDLPWGTNYIWTLDDLHVDNPALQPSWESHNNSESLSHVEFNNISDGSYAGRQGNINIDPMFVDPGVPHFGAPGSDWHLQSGSPVIDQAPVDSETPITDLDGNRRYPRNGMVDMGAYEFRLAHPAAITIVKGAMPADGTDFLFGGDLGEFSLDVALPDDGDGINGAIAFTELITGTYIITETMPAGWDLLSVGCASNQNNDFSIVTGIDGNGVGITVHLNPDEEVTCTFTNEMKPMLTVNKVLVPSTDDGRFALEIDGTAIVTDISSNGSTGPVRLGVGLHTVSESAGTGTDLAHYDSVVGGDCNPDGSIMLAAGQMATCTITNTRKPILTLEKILLPATDDGRFDLEIDGTAVITSVSNGSSTGPVLLTVGNHTVGETAADGTDMRLYESDIGGDCQPDGTIQLSAGQTATCTLTNSRKPTLTVQHVLLPALDSGRFNLEIDGAVVTSDVGDKGTTGPVMISPSSHSVGVTAGTSTDMFDYETTIGGDCNSDGTIVLAAAQGATCVITNTRKPAIDSTPVFTATEGEDYGYDIVVESVGAGSVLTITAPVLPDWLTLIDHGDGTATLDGTPGAGDVGDHIAVIQVADGFATATQTFTITVEALPVSPIFLPVIFNHYVPAPDLVVDALTVTPDSVQVVIRNQGSVPVSDEFWVDVYINPAPPPSAVNQTWELLSSQGLVWGVTAPLAPGATLTLTVGDEFFWADYSWVTWPLSVDAAVYAHVDSANTNTTYGAVIESHEANGGAYNNISQLAFPAAASTHSVGVVSVTGNAAFGHNKARPAPGEMQAPSQEEPWNR
ncbi:MAG: choice-of-anchor Q domain-containing protein [Anaerolineae bacterium]